MMNKYVSHLLTAAIFFGAGVFVTKLLSPDNFGAAITPRQKELQKIAIEAEHRPFFPNSNTAVIEEKKEEVESKEKVQAEPGLIQEKPFDYVQLSGKINAFRDQMFEVINKKFKLSDNSKKEIQLNQNRLRDKLDYLFGNKNFWFKSTVEYDENNKFFVWFNYYQCNQKTYQIMQKFELAGTCFMLKFYTMNGGKWYQYSLSSDVGYLNWLSDIPYLKFDTEQLGSFSKATSILQAVVPAPDDQSPIYFLKYEDGKFKWETGKEVAWVVTSEKEAAAFQKKVNDYSVAHGDRLDR